MTKWVQDQARPPPRKKTAPAPVAAPAPSQPRSPRRQPGSGNRRGPDGFRFSTTAVDGRSWQRVPDGIDPR